MSMQGFGGWTADQINSSMGMGPGGAGSFNQGVFDAAIGGMNPAYTPYVGGYPSFGEASPVGPGTGLSSFSGKSLIGTKGGDAGIAGWGSAPISPTFSDRWGNTPYDPVYQVPDIIANGGYQPAPQPPAAAAPYDSGIRTGMGGGGWDTQNQFGQPYSPYGGRPYDEGDPTTWGAIGWSDAALGYSSPMITGKEAQALWQKQSGQGPGQAYGPGYVDNTWGAINENQAQQAQRDAIARATIQYQQQQQQQQKMPSAVFGGHEAEAMWRDPFAQRGYNLGATGIYQDPFGGYNSSNAVAPNGLSGNLSKPDYQYGGFGDDNQVFGPTFGQSAGGYGGG